MNIKSIGQVVLAAYEELVQRYAAKRVNFDLLHGRLQELPGEADRWSFLFFRKWGQMVESNAHGEDAFARGKM